MKIKTDDPPDCDLGDFSLQFIEPGDIAIDIGCGAGNWTAPLVNAGAFVYGCDMHQPHLDALNRRVSSNVKIECLAIFSENNFFRDHGHSIFTAPWITLDSWMERENPPAIKFIKIDIEGAELDALTGAQETLKRFKPIVQVETHPDRIDNLHERLKELMSGIGYRLIKEAECPHQKWFVWSDEEMMRRYGYKFIGPIRTNNHLDYIARENQN